MDRGLVRLAAARAVTLYLLSLLAVAGADLAWRPPDVLRLAAYAATLGLAVALGTLLPDALSAVGAAGLRARARLVAFLFLPLPGLVALAVAVAAPGLAAQAASALALLQIVVLLFGEALAIEVLVLWGALVLTLVAALAGGLPALAGLTGFFTLAAVFLGLDHVSRRLAAWPGTPAPAIRLVLAEALRAIAAPLTLLVLVLLLVPASAPSSFGDDRAVRLPAEVRRAYQWLVLVALAGGGTVTFLMRFLRGGGSEAPTLVEPTESRVEAEEPLEPAAFDETAHEPARGRVIRAYVRFLSRARESGLRLERHLTPREIEDRVRRPEGPLSALTGLFMDARYGPDEPALDAVRSAEKASRDVCAALDARPRSTRGRRPRTSTGEAS
jgi:hypothetical protein